MSHAAGPVGKRRETLRNAAGGVYTATNATLP
jgi:hypothetical protein